MPSRPSDERCLPGRRHADELPDRGNPAAHGTCGEWRLALAGQACATWWKRGLGPGESSAWQASSVRRTRQSPGKAAAIRCNGPGTSPTSRAAPGGQARARAPAPPAAHTASSHRCQSSSPAAPTQHSAARSEPSCSRPSSPQTRRTRTRTRRRPPRQRTGRAPYPCQLRRHLPDIGHPRIEIARRHQPHRAPALQLPRRPEPPPHTRPARPVAPPRREATASPAGQRARSRSPLGSARKRALWGVD